MLGIVEIFNKAAHFGAGAWAGLGLNDQRYRWGVLVLSALFAVYQLHESSVKKDAGYPELRQFMIGMFGILAFKRAQDWIENHPDEWEQIKDEAKSKYEEVLLADRISWDSDWDSRGNGG